MMGGLYNLISNQLSGQLVQGVTPEGKPPTAPTSKDGIYVAVVLRAAAGWARRNAR
jgi:hypothetical protein